MGVAPYVTGGGVHRGYGGACTAGRRRVGRRRATDFASNVGAGVGYRLADWLGVGADYRRFFLLRDRATPTVHRLTAGVMLSLK